MGIENRKFKAGNKYRATISIKDLEGRIKKIRGPYRAMKSKARSDFFKMQSGKGSVDVSIKEEHITFMELASNFITSRNTRGIEQSTKNFYKTVLDKYLLPQIGYCDVNRITPDLLEGAFAKLRESKIKDGKRISNKQYNHIISTCRSIFNFGITHRKCKYNPANAIDKINIPEQIFTYLSPNEVRTFLNFARDKHVSYRVPYYVYLLGFNLGLRIGELIALKWEKIDFQKETILICRTYDKQAYKIKNYTKGKRSRVLYMNRAVEVALRELRVLYPESEFVFLNPTGTGHIYYRNFRDRIFLHDVKGAGVTYFDFHGMRHTFAISFLMNRGLPQDLQLILGHENITTTMRYVKFASDYLKNKASIVEFEAELPEGVQRLPVRK